MHVNDRKDGKTIRDSSDVVLETLFQGAVLSKGEKACAAFQGRGGSPAQPVSEGRLRSGGAGCAKLLVQPWLTLRSQEM